MWTYICGKIHACRMCVVLALSLGVKKIITDGSDHEDSDIGVGHLKYRGHVGLSRTVSCCADDNEKNDG